MNRREILAILGASICSSVPAGAEEDHSAHMPQPVWSPPPRSTAS